MFNIKQLQTIIAAVKTTKIIKLCMMKKGSTGKHLRFVDDVLIWFIFNFFQFFSVLFEYKWVYLCKSQKTCVSGHMARVCNRKSHWGWYSADFIAII